MAKIVVEVILSATQYEAAYSGVAKNVVASSLDGRKVQLPLSAFQPFVSYRGVNGIFEVEFDSRNKLVGVTQIR
ncbi:DUF2835 family protein [Marinomonas pollencensis]|uniref:Uncharacterized protein DUF2835 n=1 Tax=Marinomonas pollencensis TaxID=491954 RepID=A0A3E0DSI1_9GAMM|nr:DUF2835 family protein [Marinomonas pollencensis]REG86482.1 uncharacterized protein DUF2835 [Marinomonas pollencensis]